MNSEIKGSPERGMKAARYFGAEAEANPGSLFWEYTEDIASYWGKEKWGDLTKEEQKLARELFRQGREDERKAVGG